jgi:predicted anti-sigma-YlaC factor YlaD
VSGEMDCVDVVELVTDYLEGALDEPTRQRVEQHVEHECLGCREYVEQMRRTRQQLGHLPAEPELPDDLRASLLAAFRNRKV